MISPFEEPKIISSVFKVSIEKIDINSLFIIYNILNYINKNN